MFVVVCVLVCLCVLCVFVCLCVFVVCTCDFVCFLCKETSLYARRHPLRRCVLELISPLHSDRQWLASLAIGRADKDPTLPDLRVLASLVPQRFTPILHNTWLLRKGI